MQKKINLSMRYIERYDHVFIYALIFYFGLGLFKISSFALTGRFFAEEGVVFYPSISNKEIFASLFFIFNGHMEFITNFVIFLSTHVNLKYAPLVTTYLSFLIQGLPLILLIKYRKQFELDNWRIFFILLVSVGLPQSAEVYANSINLHFHFSLMAAIILAINIQEEKNKTSLRILLFFSGISGIPANFLMPIYAIEAIKTKERERWIHFAIIFSTTIFQLLLLISNKFEGGNRDYLSGISAFFLAPLLQNLISPILGFVASEKLALIIINAKTLESGSIFLASICCVPLVWLTIETFKRKKRSFIIFLISAWVLVFMNIFASLGDKNTLISSAGGGRYFYASNVLLTICLCTCINLKEIIAKMFIFFLAFTSINNLHNNFSGPNWLTAVQEWEVENDKGLKIWPEGWIMRLKR